MSFKKFVNRFGDAFTTANCFLYALLLQRNSAGVFDAPLSSTLNVLLEGTVYSIGSGFMNMFFRPYSYLVLNFVLLYANVRLLQ